MVESLSMDIWKRVMAFDKLSIRKLDYESSREMRNVFFMVRCLMTI